MDGEITGLVGITVGKVEMDASMVARLNALNRDFYRHHATSFDAKRQAPWPGWERVAALLSGGGPHSILDVGCGNGRFGLFLQHDLEALHPHTRLDYCGVDASRELLEIAAARAPHGWCWIEADLVTCGFPAEVAGRFDLVTCFGVMHHVPGEATRRRLLDSMARRVAPEGHLAVSFWQFGNSERFTTRALDWGRLGREAAALEDNDYLLPWGDATAAPADRPVRYCHFVGRDEAHRLVDGLGLSIRSEFVADGRSGELNRYFLLQPES